MNGFSLTKAMHISFIIYFIRVMENPVRKRFGDGSTLLTHINNVFYTITLV